MSDYFTWLGVVLCLLMLMALYRTVIGPTIIDRIMGANVIGTKTVVLLIIIGTIFGRVEMFVDIALAYAMLNFIVTIAASRYFTHHKNILQEGYGLRHRPGGPKD
ncbi:MAG: pH regulation protein F [Proteobacteria bacterium]|nr:pH regulation protein F [Pseudomonadota bacterium]MBU1688478.1 pH regulation protein F [Pseudomonadota bacterium]